MRCLAASISRQAQEAVCCTIALCMWSKVLMSVSASPSSTEELD
jgi:hypothetical protein